MPMPLDLQLPSAAAPRCTPRAARIAPLLLILLVSLISSGCDSGPEAPVLRDSPVYNNRREGFRFLVPDGWIQTASSVLPRGELQGETFLARYRMNTPDQGATLMIIATDGDEVEDLERYHAAASFRVEKWTVVESAEEVTIGDQTAQRLVYSGLMAKRPMTKEVVVFRQNDRLYHFVGLFWESDEKARQQIRRALDSIIWE